MQADNKKETVTTEINFLEVPIFDVSSGSTENKNYKYVKKYKNRYGTEDKVTITCKSRLTGFDRKILYGIEYLYLKQNINFESEKIITTIRQLEKVIGYKDYTASHKIVNSIKKLFSTDIEAIIYEKKENGKIEPSTRLFHLLDYVNFDQNIYSKIKKTTKVEITLNDFHINNFRNKYYRLLNFSLIKSLKKNISIRLFDYLNLKSYKLSKDGRYKQKTEIRLDYNTLCDYLHIKQEKVVSKVKQQLVPSLDELKEKTVIIDYEIEKDLFKIWIYLKLNRSINLWTKYKPKLSELEDVEVLTPIQEKLRKYGISLTQIKKISRDYTENYIQDKLKQVEYLFQHTSKVKNIGSYLYNSLKEDWKEQLFEDYKQDKKQRELSLLTKQKEKEHEELVTQYEKYLYDTCLDYYNNTITKEDKEQIDKEVKEIVDNNKIAGKNKSIKKLYEESTTVRLIQEKSEELQKLHLLNYQDWKKQ